ncbi:IclR family transcriptional regulator [Cohnella nanjingensis]|uniref:IclR family transcriptional regulator n=1 Tax=Cohnella nanjingensis TaxID=1387779 RepID=A0A7X0RXD0_9BACL|nr:IclR family transcriptional regulator [Cohnella nanjingensis]MBB6675402.1 IclR family transcriptional regulator [Cohnella nanjingensis]
MNGTQTLSRALDILFALSEAEGTLSVSEISEKVSIPESTTYRFLQTLEQNGIVERRGKRQIALGLRILDLARSLNQQMQKDLLSLSLPLMERLTAETAETTALFVRTGSDVICIQNVRSKGLIQFAIENGRILPLHSGASGKSLLAFESEKLLARTVAAVANAAERRALEAELQTIRAQGYSLTKGEVDPDVFAISAPVFGAQGLAIASLSIAGPSFRCDEAGERRMIAQLRTATDLLSRKLGYLGVSAE